MQDWIILILLIAIGVYDLYLYFTKQKTLSQRVHALFPRSIDLIIMVGLLIGTWILGGPGFFVPVMLGVIVCHLFGSEW